MPRLGRIACLEMGKRKAQAGGLKAQLRDIDGGRRGSVIKEAADECADRNAFLDPEFTPT